MRAKDIAELIAQFEFYGSYVERENVDGATRVICLHEEGSMPHIDDDFVLAALSLPECAEIDSLWIPDSTVTDLSICQVAEFSKLEYLGLRGTNITDISLPTIGELQFLFSLDLSETAVTDQGVKSLLKLSQLESLNIQKTAIGDESCDLFSKFPKLTHLYLQECPITDRSLKFLQTSSTLQVVNTWNTSISESAVASFIEARPDVTINHGYKAK